MSTPNAFLPAIFLLLMITAGTKASYHEASRCYQQKTQTLLPSTEMDTERMYALTPLSKLAKIYIDLTSLGVSKIRRNTLSTAGIKTHI